MIRNFIAFFICFVFLRELSAVEPSTSITSDRMEMLRFKDHNEFMFLGNVHIDSKTFVGSCESMWVYTQTNHKDDNFIFIPFTYALTWKAANFSYFVYGKKLLWMDEAEQRLSQMGQIKLIIAKRNVFLKTEDAVTKEVKQANSQRAVIYPLEEKMVLTENPVVRCSIQGTFKGGKITFYKSSDRVVVENPEQGQRSQVLLSK